MWNTHNTRPSRNSYVGKWAPAVTLFYREDAPDTDYSECATEAESTMPCGVDVFKVCSHNMQDVRLQAPCNAQEAIELFLNQICFCRGTESNAEVVSILIHPEHTEGQDKKIIELNKRRQSLKV